MVPEKLVEGSHQSLQTFFKIVSLFFSHFGNEQAAREMRVFTGELERKLELETFIYTLAYLIVVGCQINVHEGK